MIEIINLVKKYENDKILDNINLQIEDSAIFGLIGKSGAGKSTLLNCLVGLEKYQSGSIIVDGIAIEKLNKKNIRYLRKNIGMIFQNFCLLNRKTVYENIAFTMQCWKCSKEEIDKRVKELAEIVGLTEKLYRKPCELSGGQKQRCAIARALSMKPKYLLCDEATSSLDPKTTDSILSLLTDIRKSMGITIIIITHEMEVVEKVCDYVAILDNGKIVDSGSIKKVFIDSRKELDKFIGRDIEYYIKNNTMIRLIINSCDVSSEIMWELGKKLSTPYKIIDGKKYKFLEGEYFSLLISVNIDDLEKCINLFNQKGISFEIKEGVK